MTSVPATLPRRARLALALVVGLLAACTGERPELSEESSSTTTTEGTTTTTVPDERAFVAQAKEPAIDVYESKEATEPARQIVSGVDTSDEAVPVVFLVLAGDPEVAERIEVYLPTAPNGSTGWVDSSDVDVTGVPYRITVGRTERRLRVFEDQEVILDEPVGFGPCDELAADGLYFLRELVQPPDGEGPLGPYAFALPGFPGIPESVNEGTEVVGIHGTNEPDEVGSERTSGCIALQNDVITRLVEDIGLPLGTPVEVEG